MIGEDVGDAVTVDFSVGADAVVVGVATGVSADTSWVISTAGVGLSETTVAVE
jgi:hypothetical protein